MPPTTATSTTPQTLTTTCCIAGGGPAGMMLGFLLARAGVDVVVLEKHGDFLRDFRGDTVHPSTLEVIHELGLLDDFLRLPHQELARIGGQIGATPIDLADFSHLPTRCKFIAFMPQWDFLNFLVEHGARYPGFHVRMNTAVTDLLLEEDGPGDKSEKLNTVPTQPGRVTGVRASGPDGPDGPDRPIEIRADLVVGADGRRSLVRARAGLEVEDVGAPMDVLWLRLSRRPDDAHAALGYIGAGRFFVMIDRGDYWQCGYIIKKGGYDEVRAAGLPAFRAALVELQPALAERVAEIADWDHVSLLTVAVDHLRQWYRPGLVCIGDAAHAMSPVGGVGINLAVQDAVAAANILAAPLRDRALTLDHLAQLQHRRVFPTRATQALQVFIQKQVIEGVLDSHATPEVPWAVHLMQQFKSLQRLPARLIGMGFRPEHVRTEEWRRGEG